LEQQKEEVNNGQFSDPQTNIKAGVPYIIRWTTAAAHLVAPLFQEVTICNEFYDLHGRRVATPRKGLYIHNGKKVVVK